MKKLIGFITWCCISFYAVAQTTTGKITGLKDAWGESITYIGEIKNKQPNGLGVATYSNDVVIRYSGNFLNGQYNGKGVMLFKNGTFLSGEWKNGKLNGKGSNLGAEGDLYIGDFVNGERNGKGTYFYKDNSVVIGQQKADKYYGRCIFIPADATTISDNIYVDGKKNGPGYQYEVSGKKLYEGTWKNGDWVSSGTAGYYSFLKHADFYSEKTDDQILMGPLDKERLLTDTSFYYDLKKKKRYFGYSVKGLMENGIIIKDDSSRFQGNLNDDGAYGYAYFYKIGKFYDEGNYAKDYLNGDNCLSIDLKDKTVYYGGATNKGEFTGKAWFCSKGNELYSGDYKKGNFTGTGFKINRDGYCIRGTWDDGGPVTISSITDDKGQPVSLAAKTLAEAIGTVARESTHDLDIFLGVIDDDYDSEGYEVKYFSTMNFPGSLKKDYVLDDEDYNLNYVSTFLETSDFAAAKAKYADLCKQLSGAKITVVKGQPAVDLDGTPNDPDADEDTNSCIFRFPDSAGIEKDYAASVLMVKGDDDVYRVSVVIGYDDAAMLSGY